MASQGRQLHPATIRRIQILRQTLSVRQTARALDISPPTVQKYEAQEQPEPQSQENPSPTENSH